MVILINLQSKCISYTYSVLHFYTLPTNLSYLHKIKNHKKLSFPFSSEKNHQVILLIFLSNEFILIIRCCSTLNFMRLAYSGWVGIKLIPACSFPFICCMVFALNQSNQIGIGLKKSECSRVKKTVTFSKGSGKKNQDIL